MGQPPVTNLVPANGFLVEFDGGALTSPHIHKVTGLSRKTGTVDIVDGGTNQKLPVRLAESVHCRTQRQNDR